MNVHVPGDVTRCHPVALQGSGRRHPLSPERVSGDRVTPFALPSNCEQVEVKIYYML